MQAVPSGANLGLGCGNPIALASIREGETVLDLGSGAGFDCFLASNIVGPTGLVIGVDMTEEMVARARDNARKGGYGNVEFRSGEIEALPVEDNTIDIIISNCVINLVPDKERAFRGGLQGPQARREADGFRHSPAQRSSGFREGIDPGLCRMRCQEPQRRIGIWMPLNQLDSRMYRDRRIRLPVGLYD